jgi:hypothetical protein
MRYDTDSAIAGAVVGLPAEVSSRLLSRVLHMRLSDSGSALIYDFTLSTTRLPND